MTILCLFGSIFRFYWFLIDYFVFTDFCAFSFQAGEMLKNVAGGHGISAAALLEAKNQVLALQQKLSGKENELTKIATKYSEITTKYSETSELNTSMQAEITKLQERDRQSSAVVNQLMGDVESLKKSGDQRDLLGDVLSKTEHEKVLQELQNSLISVSEHEQKIQELRAALDEEHGEQIVQMKMALREQQQVEIERVGNDLKTILEQNRLLQQQLKEAKSAPVSASSSASDNSELNMQLESLRLENQSYQLQVDTYKTQLEQLNRDVRENVEVQESSSTEFEINTLKAENKAYLDKIEELNVQLQRRDEMSGSAAATATPSGVDPENQLAATQTENQTLRAHIQELTSRLMQYSEVGKYIEALQAENTNCKQHIENLNVQIKQSELTKTENETLRTQIEALNVKIQQIADGATGTSRRRDDDNDNDVSILKEENVSQKELIEELNVKLKQSGAMFAQVAEHYEGVTQEKAAIAEMNDRYKTQIENLTVELQSVLVLKERLQSVESELAAFKESRGEKEPKNTGWEDTEFSLDSDELLEKVRSLEKENEDFQQELVVLHGNLRNFEEVEKESVINKEKLETLNEKLNEYEESVEKAEFELRSLKKSHQRELETIMHQYEMKSKLEVEEVTKELHNTRNEVEKLRNSAIVNEVSEELLNSADDKVTDGETIAENPAIVDELAELREEQSRFIAQLTVKVAEMASEGEEGRLRCRNQLGALRSQLDKIYSNDSQTPRNDDIPNENDIKPGEGFHPENEDNDNESKSIQGLHPGNDNIEWEEQIGEGFHPENEGGGNQSEGFHPENDDDIEFDNDSVDQPENEGEIQPNVNEGFQPENDHNIQPESNDAMHSSPTDNSDMPNSEDSSENRNKSSTAEMSLPDNSGMPNSEGPLENRNKSPVVEMGGLSEGSSEGRNESPAAELGLEDLREELAEKVREIERLLEDHQEELKQQEYCLVESNEIKMRQRENELKVEFHHEMRQLRVELAAENEASTSKVRKEYERKFVENMQMVQAELRSQYEKSLEEQRLKAVESHAHPALNADSDADVTHVIHNLQKENKVRKYAYGGQKMCNSGFSENFTKILQKTFLELFRKIIRYGWFLKKKS